MANQNDDTNTSNRGFASMDTDRQREIASQGGKAAHESGNAHEFTSEEAREAGSRSHINDNNSGGRGRGRSRDDDEDDDRGGRSGGRGRSRSRDDDDDYDDRGSRSGGRGRGGNPPRDEQGRFTSR